MNYNIITISSHIIKNIHIVKTTIQMYNIVQPINNIIA